MVEDPLWKAKEREIYHRQFEGFVEDYGRGDPRFASTLHFLIQSAVNQTIQPLVEQMCTMAAFSGPVQFTMGKGLKDG